MGGARCGRVFRTGSVHVCPVVCSRLCLCASYLFPCACSCLGSNVFRSVCCLSFFFVSLAVFLSYPDGGQEEPTDSTLLLPAAPERHSPHRHRRRDASPSKNQRMFPSLHTLLFCQHYDATGIRDRHLAKRQAVRRGRSLLRASFIGLLRQGGGDASPAKVPLLRLLPPSSLSLSLISFDFTTLILLERTTYQSCS